MYQKILNDILLSEKPSHGIYKLIETGEMKKIIPEVLKMKGFNQQTHYHDKDVLDHTMAVLDSIKPTLKLRMAALLHDISKPDCFTVDEKGRGHFYGHHIKSAEQSVIILKRLGYDDDFIQEVKILIRYHYIKDMKIDENRVEKFINEVGRNRLNDMFELNIADIKGKADPNNFDSVDRIKDMCLKYLRENENKIHCEDSIIIK
jgi:UTP:GlnB (protein PII) uridylyltransferase